MSQNDLALIATEAGHLMARYTRAADKRDFGSLAEVFTEDVVMTIDGDTVIGRGDVMEWYRDAISPDGWSQHLIGNQLVESVDDDTVTFSSYFQATSVTGDEASVTMGAYHITARRENDALLIAHNAISVEKSYTATATN